MKNEDPGRFAELEEEIEQLRGQNKELRTQLDKREDDARLATRSAVGFGGRVLLGLRLRSSFHAWLKAKSLRDPLPAEETADVLAAILRRVVRVGFVGLLVALVPSVFLLWQNLLMKQQINQQAADTLTVRRAQLLATIYEEDCEPPPEMVEGIGDGGSDSQKTESETGKTVAARGTRVVEGTRVPSRICRPRSTPRARREAVVAFCEIERNRQTVPDLSRANLSHIDLTGVDLQAVNLNGAKLVQANLLGVNLREAYLRWANLYQANLYQANLSEAYLTEANLNKAFLAEANLRGAILSAADLSEAYLRGAKLRGAKLSGEGPHFWPHFLGKKLRPDTRLISGTDLSGAKLRWTSELTQYQVDSAKGDSKTQLPPSLKRPQHWQPDSPLPPGVPGDHSD